MGTKADRAHKGAGWIGLGVAMATAAGSYWERDAMRLEGQQAAAQAAAYAKVDAVDEINHAMLATTASITIAIDRTKRIDVHEQRIQRLEALHMARRARHTAASRSIVLPGTGDPLAGVPLPAARQRVVIPPASKKAKRARVKAAAEQYMQEAF